MTTIKLSDTEIQITNGNEPVVIDIPSTKVALEEDKSSLADLEIRYAEQKLNLENLIEKNQGYLDAAESVGIHA